MNIIFLWSIICFYSLSILKNRWEILLWHIQTSSIFEHGEYLNLNVSSWFEKYLCVLKFKLETIMYVHTVQNPEFWQAFKVLMNTQSVFKCFTNLSLWSSKKIQNQYNIFVSTWQHKNCIILHLQLIMFFKDHIMLKVM